MQFNLDMVVSKYEVDKLIRENNQPLKLYEEVERIRKEIRDRYKLVYSNYPGFYITDVYGHRFSVLMTPQYIHGTWPAERNGNIKLTLWGHRKEPFTQDCVFKVDEITENRRAFSELMSRAEAYTQGQRFCVKCGSTEAKEGSPNRLESYCDSCWTEHMKRRPPGACCDEAYYAPCVCSYHWRCGTHNKSVHVGTHD